MAPIRRPSRNLPARRPNPLRDMMLEKQRAVELARERMRAQQMAVDLPSIVKQRVGEQMQKLEDKLVSEFREIGTRVVTDSTTALTNQLGSRIDLLERVSHEQTRTLNSLRDSSKMASEKVSGIVDSIESSLAGAVPGFKLDPMSPPTPSLAPQSFVHPQFQLEPPKKQLVKAGTQAMTETEEVKGRVGFCPMCTSQNVRRTGRQGMFEEFLRLFFIAPFRCRACKHKFYRF